MYCHRYLNIDLSSSSFHVQEENLETVLKYIGGSGLGAHALFAGTCKKTDPLGPDNLLIFNTGPYTGTRIPCSGRHSVVAKSPLTGIWGESDVGGRWGTMLKKTGFDGVIIRGKSLAPVYIFINEDDIIIKKASHLWGKDTHATSSLLKEELGKRVQIACIGKAGERGVLLASIMHDGKDSRAAGRCGLGAVMGSKNLKAIAVFGNKTKKVFDKGSLDFKIKSMLARIKNTSSFLGCYGTSGGIMSLEASGDLPIKNFSMGRWQNAENLSGEVMAKRFLKGRFACGACPVGCGRKISITSGKYSGVEGAGPEYETMGSFGSYCLVDNLEAVCKANELCNQYGMDTISVGAAVAFAMEAFEKELITKTDCGGLSLTWGNSDAMVELVKQIGENQGFGIVLGKGVRSASKVIGMESKPFALHVKGLELPAHDPRAYFSTGLSYATSNRGACHLAGLTHCIEGSITVPELGLSTTMDRFSIKQKGEMVAKMQDLMGLFDSLKICKFLLYADISVTDLLDCLNYVTGWNMDMEEMLKAGKRMFNLKRMYNIECGITSQDDCLPVRLTKEPLAEGGTGGNCPDMDTMINDYYAFRGWNKKGIPGRDVLEELEI